MRIVHDTGVPRAGLPRPRIHGHARGPDDTLEAAFARRRYGPRRRPGFSFVRGFTLVPTLSGSLSMFIR